jgi:hypothetical protein
MGKFLTRLWYESGDKNIFKVHCQGEGENIEIIQMGALGGVNDRHHRRADLYIIHGDMVMVCSCDDVPVLSDLEQESYIPIIMCIFFFIFF